MIFTRIGDKANHYLNGTYVVIKRGDTERIYYTQSNGAEIIATRPNNEGFKITSRNIQKLEFLCPVLGYFGFGRHYRYISRKPARRWRVGISEDNINHPEIFRDDITPDLERIKDNIYPSYDEAIEALDKGGITAISRAYAIRRSDDKFFLDYRGSPVGEIKNGVVEVETDSENDFHTRTLASIVGYRVRFQTMRQQRIVDYDEDDI